MGEKDPYADTLAYLYRQLPMFQREGPPAFKKDLTNTIALLDHLGRPEKEFPSIHIAGTNGKGSVSHMLAAMLQARGMRIGLYTSPHYIDFRERIKINGILMDPGEVVSFVAKHRPVIERVRPSFFEITVAMAFHYFARQQVDLAVIETGLGGRLDSTNVLMPLLSVITNISYDHQEFLGDTLTEIAGEKAGIIKPGIPVVVGESHPETRDVFARRAEVLNAPLTYADEHFTARLLHEDLSFSEFDVEKDREPFLSALYLGLGGPYQQTNLLTALQAVLTLPSAFRPEEYAIRTGLREIRELTYFMGRWQQIGNDPLVLCDSAHNEAGLRMVLARLMEMAKGRVHIVLGALKDKPVEKFLSLFPKQATYYFARPDIPRGMPADRLAEIARSLGLQGEVYAGVPDALAAARSVAKPEDIVFVGGSIFVVAEVIPKNRRP